MDSLTLVVAVVAAVSVFVLMRRWRRRRVVGLLTRPLLSESPPMVVMGVPAAVGVSVGEERLRVCALVTGTVQAVYYRESTVRKATLLGLDGWVRNLEDGRVEVVAEGPRIALDALISWCWKGPAGAHEVGIHDPLTRNRRVTGVSVSWEAAPSGADDELRGQGFTVR